MTLSTSTIERLTDSLLAVKRELQQDISRVETRLDLLDKKVNLLDRKVDEALDILRAIKGG